LHVRPRGFYAWLKASLCESFQEGQRQAELIKAGGTTLAGCMAIENCSMIYVTKVRLAVQVVPHTWQA
jgi:hypothetical protein